MAGTTKLTGLWIGLLALTAGACTQSDRYLQFGPPVDVAGFITVAAGGQHVWTPEALAARFGAPVRQQRQDSLTVYHYMGFELGLAGDTLRYIAYTESRHTAPEGIRVGWAATQVQRRFGPPLTSGQGRWTYRTEGGLLVLSISEGIVTRMEWRLEQPAGGR